MDRRRAAYYLLNVSRNFDLNEDTELCAINYLDRYIVKAPGMNAISLQLAACASLLIAAKFFDRKLPAPSELALVFDPSASLSARFRDRSKHQEQIVNMELDVISTLGWRLQMYSPSSFVLLLCDVCDIHCSAATSNTIKALIRLATVGCLHARYSSSIIAAAAVLGAHYVENSFEQLLKCSPSIAHALDESEDTVHACMFEVARLHAGCGRIDGLCCTESIIACM